MLLPEITAVTGVLVAADAFSSKVAFALSEKIVLP